MAFGGFEILGYWICFRLFAVCCLLFAKYSCQIFMEPFKDILELRSHSRLRRRDGHDALLEGHLHQSLL